MCSRDRLAAGPARRTAVALALAAICVVAGPDLTRAQPTAVGPSRGCVTCHALLDDSPTSPVRMHATSRHASTGVTCIDCHGGNDRSDDAEVAMSSAAGFRPLRPAVGATSDVASATGACGGCHAAFETRLRASPHAAVFEAGCVECHGNHAIATPSEAMLGMADGALCATCHGDDAGAKAATSMRTAIDRLRGAIDASAEQLDGLHRAGMDVAAEQLTVREARTLLTLARTETHSVGADAVDRVVSDGRALIATIDAAADAASAELRYRRQGLVASLGAIALVVAALVAKIRRIERPPTRVDD